MDFARDDDRQMLFDTLTRFLAERYPPERRMRVAYAPPYHDPETWSALAELGILSVLAPEARGGFGGGAHDVATVFEALGAGLCAEPVLPALLGLRVLLATDRDLAPALQGAQKLALAFAEGEGGLDFRQLAAEARQTDGSWVLTGRKSVVYGGQLADVFLVAARHGGGLGLFELAADAARVEGFGMVDGGGAAELLLDATPAHPLMLDGLPTLADALAWGCVALCAEAVGAMDRTMALLTDYLQTRKQFGRPIGAFQALQHRFVDLAIEVEQARSITILAADALGGREAGPDMPRPVSMAKHLVGKIARLVAEEAVQMHGGFAMTWEAQVAHYAKRLVMIDHQLGDTDDHLERLMAGVEGDDRDNAAAEAALRA
ncbi:MAG: acyl-CoA dehydrogenase family protein [Pseudomonadota bacterium]